MRTQALAIPNTNRLANLHLSLLKSAGVPIDKFGDSTILSAQLSARLTLTRDAARSSVAQEERIMNGSLA